MLACARSRVSRAVPRRCFATVVDASGIRVAAVDHGQPSTTVTVVVKAGSRHESKPGVAHLLKNYAFKVRNRHLVRALQNPLLKFRLLLLAASEYD